MTSTDQLTVKNEYSLADHILLQLYAPTSVVVDDNGEILYITGRTGKYLEPVAGKTNWNIYAMAREGLHCVLPGAFRKVMHNIDAVIIRNIKVGTNEEALFVDISVQRIENPKSLKGMIVVIFTDVPSIIKDDTKSPTKQKLSLTGRVKELQVQLQLNLDELLILREKLLISQVELKSANEALRKRQESLYKSTLFTHEIRETIPNSLPL